MLVMLLVYLRSYTICPYFSIWICQGIEHLIAVTAFNMYSNINVLAEGAYVRDRTLNLIYNGPL
jgi:hypothetical protein